MDGPAETNGRGLKISTWMPFLGGSGGHQTSSPYPSPGQIRTDFNKWVDSDEQSIDVKDDKDLEAAWSMPSVSRTAALKGGDGMPWMNFEQVGNVIRRRNSTSPRFFRMVVRMGGAGGTGVFSGASPRGWMPSLEHKSTVASSSKRKTRHGDGDINDIPPGNEGAEGIAEEGDESGARKKRKRTTDDAKELGTGK
ncbi:hypothetical protein B0H14DRAFT_2652331 [Mycena olivaceomarginata]|nr:hypothetical protein B0H14DRAFT_2652331 [Mycena olivaceomarginata]